MKLIRLRKRILGLGLQRLFARKENRDLDNWGIKKIKDYEIPEGAVMYCKDKRNEYYEYNVVWAVPNLPNGKQIQMTKFILDESYKTDPIFQKDLAELKKRDDAYQLLKRLDICIQDLKDGYVFKDNDDRIYDNSLYNDKDNDVYYKWDTETHYLARFQGLDMDVLPYTKRLSDRHRLSYKVHRPVKINGVYVCRVELNQCYGHSYEGIDYGVSKNALCNIAKIGKLRFLYR